MRAGERIADIGIAERRQRRNERRVVGPLAAVESQILQQRDLAFAQPVHDRRRRLADAVGREDRHSGAERLPERTGQGLEGERLLDALGPPEMRHQDDARARRA